MSTRLTGTTPPYRAASRDHDHDFIAQGDAANNLLDLRQPHIVMGYVIYTGVA